ncbi:MAG: hypothetical protein Ct9H90mP26_2270 [Methanobacteriota archaeon]|nr:MAG: hypothetical protein Ct9H90mP26_2270 [Euryarchaeota archaeon]
MMFIAMSLFQGLTLTVGWIEYGKKIPGAPPEIVDLELIQTPISNVISLFFLAPLGFGGLDMGRV